MYDGSQPTNIFNGNWDTNKADKTYEQQFVVADQQYSRLLSILLAQLREQVDPRVARRTLSFRIRSPGHRERFVDSRASARTCLPRLAGTEAPGLCSPHAFCQPRLPTNRTARVDRRAHRGDVAKNQRSCVQVRRKDQAGSRTPHLNWLAEMGPECVADRLHDSIGPDEQKACSTSTSDAPFLFCDSPNRSKCRDRAWLSHGYLRRRSRIDSGTSPGRAFVPCPATADGHQSCTVENRHDVATGRLSVVQLRRPRRTACRTHVAMPILSRH